VEVLPFSAFSLRGGQLSQITLVEAVSWKWSQFWKIPASILLAGVRKGSPNQGIKLSLRNSLVIFMITSLVGWALSRDSFMLIFGLMIALSTGGSAAMQHYALRLTVWRKGYAPLNIVKFLDQCEKLIFLKKVGGGYIFIHRMLLDYFADLPPPTSKVADGKTGPVGR
jgi:hypothetical protein